MNAAKICPGLRALLLSVSLVVAPSLQAAPPAPPVPAVLTPGQAAFMQAETRRIEENFIQKVMSITGATHAQVVRRFRPRAG